jgi:hypothetical protein
MIKPHWIPIFCLLASLGASAQEVPNPVIEQQLENQAEADEAETEDDSYYQQLQLYRRRPLNINTLTESDLAPFRWLTDLHVSSFFTYRRLAGPFISIYELQAIPNWDLETINRTAPFLTAGPSQSLAEDLGSRLRLGDHSLLLRVSQVLEESRGYQPRDTLPPAYPGSPQRLLVRYKYVYKNLLQFGILGEKDPGEQFFKGAQKQGFDFYSFHLFVRNIGVVKQLAVGDFTVNLGQGLLTYQSLAFRKSVDVMNIKRQTETFRPYNSPGEVNFVRGAAIAVGGDKWRLSVFASRQKVSANAVVDSVNFEDFVSSISTSGFHRTQSETADRRNITQSAIGGRIAYKDKGLWVAVNGIHYQLSKPLQRDSVPYNRFQFGGKSLTGFSADVSYTWRNFHMFGEFAANPDGAKAMLGGILASLDPRVDIALQARSIDKDYHSLYGNAFTESTTPINERGLYMGIALRPNRYLRIDAYADLFRFPWIRFRVDRVSAGKDYVVQLTWKPNKQVEMYMRYRSETKAINYSDVTTPLNQTEDVPRQNWRTQVSYRVSPSVTLRARTELIWYDWRGAQAEQGFHVYTDFFYKPMMSRLALNARLMYFETDGFNSRLYAYENDVLYSFSIPPFFDHGYRTYFNANYDITRKVTAWFRIARTTYTNRESVGSGNDEIAGNHRTDYRFQMLFRF